MFTFTQKNNPSEFIVEQLVKNNEQRAKGKEQRAKSKEQRAKSSASSKQQVLDADPEAIQQTNFTRNLSGNNNRLIFLIIEELKETILDFSQGTTKVF